MVGSEVREWSGPAGVKRLYDLVKMRDETLRCAFFYALRDSLVANDLEQASKIAYSGNRRWARVVTLQVQDLLNPRSQPES
jgi:structural maintenance of chromosome 4